MTAWTSFIKEFFENERKNYKKCANSGNLKRASKIYKCQKKMAEKIAKKMSKKNNSNFSMKNPLHKNKFRKTMKKK